jgi:rRNA maturation endonuclease Nob1
MHTSQFSVCLTAADLNIAVTHKMGRYFCQKCGYKFESEKIKEICPYCGKKTVKEEETAEEIMKDVEKILQ